MLFFGRAFRLLGDDELAVLMSMLNCQRGGSRVVLKGLVMRGLEKEGDESVPFASDLRIEGKSALIATIRGGNSNRHDDYDLARSFQLCFRGASEAEALELFEEVKRIMLSRKYFDLEFDDFLSAMGKYFPTLFLDVFLGGDPREAETILRKVDKLDRHTKNPFDEIDEDVMIAWCEKNGADSYSRLAGAVCGVEFDSEDNRKRLSAIGRMLLKKAPDPVEILSVIRDEFFPTSWSGSRAQLMEQNIPVLVELKDFEDERINAWAKEFEKQYLKDIAHSWKSDIDREREDYGFE